MIDRILLPLRRAWCAALLAALPGCSLTGPPIYVEGEVPATSERVLFEVCRLSLEGNGFPVVVDRFDPVTRSLTSLWQISLHPFKGEGFRERALVTWAPGSPGRIDLSVRVEKQTNHNIAKPLDPEYADWHDAEDDEAVARLVLARIQAQLGGGQSVLE